MRRRSKSEVFRITGARQSLDEDIRGRQRRYVISMSVRTVSVILAVLLWNVTRPLAVVALVLGFVLPYVAVVIANAGRENAPSLPSTFVPGPTRQALAPDAQRSGEHREGAQPPPVTESGKWQPRSADGTNSTKDGTKDDTDGTKSEHADPDRPPSTPGSPL